MDYIELTRAHRYLTKIGSKRSIWDIARHGHKALAEKGAPYAAAAWKHGVKGAPYAILGVGTYKGHKVVKQRLQEAKYRRQLRKAQRAQQRQMGL